MDLRKVVPAIAQQEGVDPALLARVVNTESGGNLTARSPKGAYGPAQLMPGTARDMGVNINDPVDNIRGGARYLKQQMDRFKDPALALAAYNAGPGAVARAGGIPNNGETPGYVSKVMGQPQGSDDIFGFSGQGAPAPQKGGSSDDIFAMKPSQVAPAAAPQPAPSPAKAAPNVVVSDVASGLAAPFQKLGHDVLDNYRKVTARAKGPAPTIGQAASDFVGDVGDTARGIGDFFGLLGAPVNAAVNTTAGALSRYGPTAYTKPTLSFVNGKPVITGPRAMGQPEAQQALAGDINTALSAAAPAVRAPIMGPPLPTPKAMTLDQLKAAKTAAYKAVDATGVQFAPHVTTNLASDVDATMATLGMDPELHKGAASAVNAVKARAGQPQTISDLDRLRQIVHRDTQGTAADQMMGRSITDHIDAIVNNAGPADITAGNPTEAAAAIAKARDLNTRFKKTENITDRVASADLRASSTYAGGNQVNATRQNLRPLIDPKSPQRIRNLTPDETAALNGVVRGTPGTNAVRLAGKMLDPRGLLGAAVQGVFGLPSHGLSTLSIPVGMAATETGKAMTAKQIEDLLSLIAVGGKRSALPSKGLASLLAGPISTRALVGTPTVLAPLARIPSAKEPANTRR